MGGLIYGPDGAYEVKYATGADADDGEYTTALVAAVTGHKIRVLAITVTVLTTAGLFSLKNGASGATIFQAHCALGAPLTIAPPFPVGVCETGSGVALVANNGTGVDSHVNVSYIEVKP